MNIFFINLCGKCRNEKIRSIFESDSQNKRLDRKGDKQHESIYGQRFLIRY